MRPGTLGLTRRGVRPPSVGEALSVEPPREQWVLREAPGGRNEEDASLPSRTRWDPRVPVTTTHGAPRLEPGAVIAVATAACSRQVRRAGRPRRCEISSSGPVPFILGRCHSLRASGARCREHGVNRAKPASGRASRPAEPAACARGQFQPQDAPARSDSGRLVPRVPPPASACILGLGGEVAGGSH